MWNDKKIKFRQKYWSYLETKLGKCVPPKDQAYSDNGKTSFIFRLNLINTDYSHFSLRAAKNSSCLVALKDLLVSISNCKFTSG